jgi:hypothetical protein
MNFVPFLFLLKNKMLFEKLNLSRDKKGRQIYLKPLSMELQIKAKIQISFLTL